MARVTGIFSSSDKILLLRQNSKGKLTQMTNFFGQNSKGKSTQMTKEKGERRRGLGDRTWPTRLCRSTRLKFFHGISWSKWIQRLHCIRESFHLCSNSVIRSMSLSTLVREGRRIFSDKGKEKRKGQYYKRR